MLPLLRLHVCLSSASASIDLEYLRSLEHLTAEQTFYKQILEALFDAVEKTARDPNLPAMHGQLWQFLAN